MQIGRGCYISGVICTVLVAWLTYVVFVPEIDSDGDPWRATSMKILNMLERGLVNFAETTSVIEHYRVKRLSQTLRSYLYGMPENLQVEVTQIAVNGRPAIRHCPRGDYAKPLLPGIVYFHGGSWISGSAAEYLPLTTYLCNTSRAIVVSIDYSLSPEYVFPKAFDDCLKATEAILEAPEQYGIAPDQIALAGDDVGGNLALAVALNLSKEKEKDTGRSDIRLVGMFNPSLQAFDFTLPSYVRYKDGPGYLRTDDVIKGAAYQLLGHIDHHLIRAMSTSSHLSKKLKGSTYYRSIVDRDLLPYSFRQWKAEIESVPLTNKTLEKHIKSLILDPRFSPMLAPPEDLALLPHTYFICPEVDPRRDESFMAYARLLEFDSSKTEHVLYSAEPHDFLMNVAKQDLARSAIDKFTKYFNDIINSFQEKADIELIKMAAEDVELDTLVKLQNIKQADD